MCEIDLSKQPYIVEDEIQYSERKSSPMRDILYRLRKNKLAMIGLFVFLLFVLCGILAPVIAPYDYAELDLLNVLKPPSWQHLCGTDELGRDIFSRLLYGARYSLSLGLCSQVLGLTMGISLGCIAGYFGGRTDMILLRFMDVLQAIPAILLQIVISSALGGGFLNTCLALSIPHIPMSCRLIRAQFLSLREQEFVEAAKSVNCSRFRIIFKHMLPNGISPLIVTTTMAIGGTIMAAASLSYIGLGVRPPAAEWGAMLSGARKYIRSNSYMLLYPGLCIAFTVLSLNMLGDGLRDAMDPKLKN